LQAPVPAPAPVPVPLPVPVTAPTAGLFSPIFFWGGKRPVCGIDFFLLAKRSFCGIVFLLAERQKNTAWLRKSQLTP
jgi:hypothetical protein